MPLINRFKATKYQKNKQYSKINTQTNTKNECLKMICGFPGDRPPPGSPVKAASASKLILGGMGIHSDRKIDFNKWQRKIRSGEITDLVISGKHLCTSAR